MLIPLIAVMGFVVDVGWYYFTAQAAHAAAESAALAAVEYARDGVAGGGTYTCGSNNLTCQAQTNCPATVSTPITSNLQSACTYASANGFTTGGQNGKQTVTIQADTTTPVPSVPGVFVDYWTTVRVYQNNPLFFLSILGGRTLRVGVRATAAVIPAVIPNCLITLNSSTPQSISVGGSADVSVAGCGVADNSSDSDALDVSGNGQLTAASIQVNGSYNNHGCSSCISPSPATGKTLANPYASLAVPTFSSSCSATNYKLTGGSATISPGTYCGGITSSGALTLNPGTYILLGGGLNTSGNGSFTGSGVTLFNTCSPSPCNGGSSNYSPLNIGGGTTLTLSAPTTGPMQGILIFQDPTVQTSASDTMTGNSSACLTGAVYLPNSRLSFAGGSSASGCATILAVGSVSFTGNSNLGSSASNSMLPSAPKAMLIE